MFIVVNVFYQIITYCKMAWPLIWIIVNFLYSRMPFAKFGLSWHIGSLNVYNVFSLIRFYLLLEKGNDPLFEHSRNLFWRMLRVKVWLKQFDRNLEKTKLQNNIVEDRKWNYRSVKLNWANIPGELKQAGRRILDNLRKYATHINKCNSNWIIFESWVAYFLNMLFSFWSDNTPIYLLCACYL